MLLDNWIHIKGNSANENLVENKKLQPFKDLEWGKTLWVDFFIILRVKSTMTTCFFASYLEIRGFTGFNYKRGCPWSSVFTFTKDPKVNKAEGTRSPAVYYKVGKVYIGNAVNGDNR